MGQENKWKGEAEGSCDCCQHNPNPSRGGPSKDLKQNKKHASLTCLPLIIVKKKLNLCKHNSLKDKASGNSEELLRDHFVVSKSKSRGSLNCKQNILLNYLLKLVKTSFKHPQVYNLNK